MENGLTKSENTLINNSVHQERGDYLLPQIVDYIKKKNWIDPRPKYQRRLVWSRAQKSQFIESLLLNLPVPPLFLYEESYGRWEIMDGQQRSSAIAEFYEDEFELTGLRQWPSLKGKKYSEFPDIVRRSLDRRRVQVVTVLAETKSSAQFDVRKQVFERLNTGGVPLRPQEIRNCIYAGAFCDLLDELASNRFFTTLWRIPKHAPPKDLKSFPPELLENKLFARMGDCELVLRFFALNRSKFFTGAVKTALDKCMHAYSEGAGDALEELRSEFVITIQFVFEVFGEDSIDLVVKGGKGKPSRQIFDALMAASRDLAEDRRLYLGKKKTIRKKLRELIDSEAGRETLVSRHDNRNAFRERKSMVSRILKDALED